MSEVSGVRYCEHCNNYSPQKIVYKNTCPGDFDEKDDVLIPMYYENNFVTVCGTCCRLSLYIAPDEEEEYEEDFSLCDEERKLKVLRRSFWRARLVWPSKIKLDPFSIPKEIIEIYQEALKIKSIAPNAFVAQIRRALEAICFEQGIHEKTLHENLKKLTQQGKLPPLLSEVTDIIKVIGNAGAHASGPPVSYAHVFAIDDFFRVVLEYLYIAPSKLRKFKQETARIYFKTNANAGNE